METIIRWLEWLYSTLGGSTPTPLPPEPVTPDQPDQPDESDDDNDEEDAPVDPNPNFTILRLLELHNQVRKTYSVAELVLDKQLRLSAQKHANWMSRKRRLSHTGRNGSSPFDRLESEGYRFSVAGENIAQGQPNAEQAMSSWMNSPGHKANILNDDYEDVGFGATKNRKADEWYWVAVFATKSGSRRTFTGFLSQMSPFPPPLVAKDL